MVHDGLSDGGVVTGQKEVLRLNGFNQDVTIPDLAGTGNRMVIANADGVLSTQTIPTGTVTGATNGLSLVSDNVELGGTLSKPTTVVLGTSALTFNASSTGQVIVQGPTGNISGLRLSNLTGTGTVGTSGQKVLSVNASGDVVLVTDFGTANAGTVTSITAGTGIAVANGSTAATVSLANITGQSILANASGTSAAPSALTASANTVLRLGASGNLGFSKLEAADLSPTGTTAGHVLTSTGASTAPTWQALPGSTNIYNTNGVLTNNRSIFIGPSTTPRSIQ